MGGCEYFHGHRGNIADDPRPDRNQQRHIHRLHILGSFTASVAVVLPSFLIVLGMCRMYNKLKNNTVFEGVMTGVKPAVVGLIGAAAILLVTPENFPDWKSWILFGTAFLISWVWKVNPIYTIIGGGVLGLILY